MYNILILFILYYDHLNPIFFYGYRVLSIRSGSRGVYISRLKTVWIRLFPLIKVIDYHLVDLLIYLFELQKNIVCVLSLNSTKCPDLHFQFRYL